MGGTLTLWPGSNASSKYALGLERRRWSVLVFCTLLGPEGPGRRFGGATNLWTSLRLALCRRRGYRPYFENYTVDASILETNRKIRFT
jgi:hypothetical protein